MKKDFTKYFLAKFKERGRDLNGCDCWGFVRIISGEMYNKSLPAYDYDYDNIRDGKELQRIIEQYTKKLTKLEKPVDGCLVRLEMGGFRSHFGIMISECEFIHIEKILGVTVGSILSDTWKNKIIGYYEHE